MNVAGCCTYITRRRCAGCGLRKPEAKSYFATMVKSQMLQLPHQVHNIELAKNLFGFFLMTVWGKKPKQTFWPTHYYRSNYLLPHPKGDHTLLRHCLQMCMCVLLRPVMWTEGKIKWKGKKSMVLTSRVGSLNFVPGQAVREGSLARL